MSRKCILKQLSSQGSTAQNGQKWVKIAKIHYFTRGAHTAKSRFSGPSKPLKSLKNTQNDLFIPQTSMNTPEMHPKTSFIWGKYRSKSPERGQNGWNPLFQAEFHQMLGNRELRLGHSFSEHLRRASDPNPRSMYHRWMCFTFLSTKHPLSEL